MGLVQIVLIIMGGCLLITGLRGQHIYSHERHLKMYSATWESAYAAGSVCH